MASPHGETNFIYPADIRIYVRRHTNLTNQQEMLNELMALGGRLPLRFLLSPHGETRLIYPALFGTSMPGNYQKHLDEFGNCTCGSARSGVEPMSLESQDRHGRWRTRKVPACADCFGLI